MWVQNPIARFVQSDLHLHHTPLRFMSPFWTGRLNAKAAKVIILQQHMGGLDMRFFPPFYWFVILHCHAEENHVTLILLEKLTETFKPIVKNRMMLLKLISLQKKYLLIGKCRSRSDCTFRAV